MAKSRALTGVPSHRIAMSSLPIILDASLITLRTIFCVAFSRTLKRTVLGLVDAALAARAGASGVARAFPASGSQFEDSDRFLLINLIVCDPHEMHSGAVTLQTLPNLN